MAGINNLVKGAVGTLAKDKVSQYLSPAQMDFITFALNPQGYLLDKGVNAAANALGYGSQYRELKGGAEDNKEWYKEVMRDSIGDMLPDTVGDFVRATPRISEADLQPAGEYIAWNPDTQSFETQGSPRPVASSDPFASARFDAKVNPDSPYNTNSQNYVGPANPKDMDSSIYSSNLTDLLSMLDEYRAAETPEMTITGDKASFEEGDTFDADLGMNVPSNTGGSKTGGGDLSYTEMIDVLNSPSGYGGGSDTFDAGSGMNEYFGGYGGGGGGGGGKYYDDFSSQAYAKGGRVRGCNC
jgi:hypothetical protein